MGSRLERGASRRRIKFQTRPLILHPICRRCTGRASTLLLTKPLLPGKETATNAEAAVSTHDNLSVSVRDGIESKMTVYRKSAKKQGSEMDRVEFDTHLKHVEGIRL